ncbi:MULTISPECIES: DesA family fatty acid desaturase [Legionella]|uniref:Acyl-CoA desaturase n=1 Tax=Legionella septentrionalis TaxID=2498109 RepID=A0A3S0VP30_9GAMM|nr:MULTISPECIES: fatty acid desaturase [Legionella]MCP0913947.1 fatty acid desaturase [Legionella sp. 27cVA30]RUQ90391.1 acyl-CoA desaturase [Legionella septentrionalis]RUR00042.1 acyl-CoA desaturase [Legionella septentrionalis]RUR10738.1 acyl-CoA desaturase [Legionella septentrionalis]RUR16509.1 acyl-CoA desaturase [Legionella septentrionalis]
MLFGILNLSFWGYVIAALILTQITIASVTLYLHRCQTHRALTLHPIVSHFFRFWLWLTTGMVTGEWVAIHRKHHATTDIAGDPHSPQVLGLKKVFWQGAELYREATKDKAMIAKYSHGTPTDWIERNLYARHSGKGIFLMFLLDILLFGIPGITIWAMQMIWIPLWAAGVVNGVGHFWGYRNFECADAATNVFPWGFWIGGEELHNNHHTFASSAKFSVKWWEFDIGWLYIRILAFFGLAKIKKLPPKLARQEGKLHVDLDTVKAVVANRFQVMAYYYKHVVRPILRHEKRNNVANKVDKRLFQRAGRLLRRQEELLSPRAHSRLQALLNRYEQLRLVYNYRLSLQNVWTKTAVSQKELIESLQQWCKQAEESGLEVLRQFAQQLKGFVPKAITH